MGCLVIERERGPAPRINADRTGVGFARTSCAREIPPPRRAFGFADDSAQRWRVLNDYSSTGAIERDPITGVLPGPRFVVMNCSSAFLKPG